MQRRASRKRDSCRRLLVGRLADMAAGWLAGWLAEMLAEQLAEPGCLRAGWLAG